MSLELYLAFLAACVLLALAPGPAMSLIIATTVSRGQFAGLRVVAGNGTGLVVLVAAATLGTGTLTVVMADWLDVADYLPADALQRLNLAYVEGGQPEGAFYALRYAGSLEQINSALFASGLNAVCYRVS